MQITHKPIHCYKSRQCCSTWVGCSSLSVCLFVRSNSITQQEGWLSPTERASVSAVSLRHILASPGTIALNVTWMERGFNAGQRHSSMYPSIFNRLRAITIYWSEIATFSYPSWGVPIRISGKKFGPQKTRIMGLPGSEDSLTIG